MRLFLISFVIALFCVLAGVCSGADNLPPDYIKQAQTQNKAVVGNYMKYLGTLAKTGTDEEKKKAAAELDELKKMKTKPVVALPFVPSEVKEGRIGCFVDWVVEYVNGDSLILKPFNRSTFSIYVDKVDTKGITVDKKFTSYLPYKVTGTTNLYGGMMFKATTMTSKEASEGKYRLFYPTVVKNTLSENVRTVISSSRYDDQQYNPGFHH